MILISHQARAKLDALADRPWRDVTDAISRVDGGDFAGARLIDTIGAAKAFLIPAGLFYDVVVVVGDGGIVVNDILDRY